MPAAGRQRTCRGCTCPRMNSSPRSIPTPELTKRLVGVWKNSLGRQKCRDGRPDDWAEGFAEFSLPDHSIPAVGFHVGAVAPEKIAASKKPGGPPLPSLDSSKFAGARADDSQWSGRIEERGARLDKEIALGAPRILFSAAASILPHSPCESRSLAFLNPNRRPAASIN